MLLAKLKSASVKCEQNWVIGKSVQLSIREEASVLELTSAWQVGVTVSSPGRGKGTNSSFSLS